jgi:MoaA/NifB/PqqE/SkfB family radical SAM enzyme
MIVVWRVTERCNLACGFCAYDRRLERSRRDADPAAMLAFGSALAAYQRAAGDPVLVSWLGGEPLIWSPLERLTTAFVHDLGLRVSVTTNGTALASEKVRAHVLDSYDEVTVSVDALGAAHDAMRGWRGGFSQLRRVVPLLAAGRRSPRPRLRANVVLMRDNVAGFADLCLELAGWGFDEITFNQLGGNDRPEFWAEHRISPNDVDRLAGDLMELRQALAMRGVTLRGGDRYVERIRSSASGRRLRVHDCGPGERFLFVSERGIVSPCSFTESALGIPIAELWSGADVAALPARFGAARTARRASMAVCDDCPSTQVFAKFE